MWFYLIIKHIVIASCLAYEYNVVDMGRFSLDRSKEVDLNETFFSSLEDYQVNATPASESEYEWIARVVHSRTADYPHMCTAACVYSGIFVTAARCVFNLKVPYSSIIYQSQRLPVRAFVLPTNQTMQAYDDIGFIVVENEFNGQWKTVQLFDEVQRTDGAFDWFSSMDLSGPYKVLGYATTKGLHRLKAPTRVFNLTELPIVISMDICSTILTFNHHITGFGIPCYHSCSVKDFKKSKKVCSNYHGVEGGAIINTEDNKLFGVATWGAYFQYYDLPVGFSVVNSKNFHEDFACAKLIKSAKIMKTYRFVCSTTA